MMTIENIEVSETLERIKVQLKEDQDMSVTTRSLIEVLILIVTLLVNRLGLNSRNGSTLPSNDPNRKKASRKYSSKKPGAQTGHKGTTRMKPE
jgi:transposase